MTVEIVPVTGKRDLRRFIRLPYALYRDQSNWVAPLLSDVKKRLDQRHNPFFEHAEAQYFLALRDGESVGRISAHIDHHFNEFQSNDWGMFGFFESENDPATAGALLDAAADWLGQRGRDRMVGPMDFTTNDECGLLIEGHEFTPLILCPWHHPYYQTLIEGQGLTKAMDLYMWTLWVDELDVHPAILEAAAKVESEHGIRVRPMRKRDLEAEVSRFLEVYNAAWERNWGNVPLTEAEVRYYAKDLKPVLDENWAFIAEKADGEVVGAALTLPDYNQVLVHLRGRLLPFGWAKALYWRSKINQVRVFALGVKPGYQHTGVAARMYQLHFESAERTPQKGGEMGWTLENNDAINRAIAGMGGRIKRRFRIYERELIAPPTEASEPA